MKMHSDEKVENIEIPRLNGTPLQTATTDMNAISKIARTALSSICLIVDWRA